MKIESHKMLALCTSHIGHNTAGLLDMRTDDVPNSYPKDDYGWFIPVPEVPYGTTPKARPSGAEEPHTCPSDLVAVFAFARKKGFTWIMFDRDVDPIAELPTFDWN